MQGVAPIKLGEYLLCGVPVVATSEIGDTDSISSDVGFLVRCLDENELVDVANWFIDVVLERREEFRRECRDAGLEKFSLDASAKSYIDAISTLPGSQFKRQGLRDFD